MDTDDVMFERNAADPAGGGSADTPSPASQEPGGVSPLPNGVLKCNALRLRLVRNRARPGALRRRNGL